MKRISFSLICYCSLLVGCRTADSTAFTLNPAKIWKPTAEKEPTQSEIEENSRQFLADVRKQADSNEAEVQKLVQRGQQEIVSWYQDHDDRHITAAKTAFRNAMKLQPKKNVDALHGLAVVADLERNFAVAEQHYQLALAQSPGDSNLLGNLGYSYLLQNRLEESERYLLRATQIDASNVDATKHLGEVYARMGQPGNAQAVLSRVMDPEAAKRLVDRELAQAHQQSGSSGNSVPSGRDRDAQPLDLQTNDLRIASANSNTAYRPESSTGRNQLPRTPQQGFGYPPRGPLSSEDQLKQGLAEIDHERRQSVDGGPILIQADNFDRTSAPNNSGLVAQHDPRSAPVSSYENPANSHVSGYRPGSAQTQALQPQQNSMQQPSPPQMAGNGGPSVQAISNQYAEMSPYQQQQFLESQRLQRQGMPPSHGGSNNGLAARGSSTPAPNQYTMGQQQIASNQYRTATIPQQQSDPLQRPWGTQTVDNIQPVNYQNSGHVGQGNRDLQNGPSQSDSAQVLRMMAANPNRGQMPSQGMTQQLPNEYDQRDPRLAHRDSESALMRNPQGVSAGSQQGQFASSNGPDPQRQAYEEARLEAARVGMGFGPGNLFAGMNQTAPQQQPGTQAAWNGNSFDASRRMLPTDLDPLDLTQQGTVNSHGQRIPESQVTNQYGQFGTASRFDTQVRQVQQQELNQYQQEQLRVQQAQWQQEQMLSHQQMQAHNELHQQTADVWNQRPLTPHQPLPNQLQLLSPAEYGGMVPAGTPTRHVEPPPYQNGMRQQPQPTTIRNGQGDSRNGNYQEAPAGYPANYYGTRDDQQVVEPPPYRQSASWNSLYGNPNQSSVMQTNYTTPQPSGNVQPGYNSNYQMQSNGTLPMIIPSAP